MKKYVISVLESWFEYMCSFSTYSILCELIAIDTYILCEILCDPSLIYCLWVCINNMHVIPAFSLNFDFLFFCSIFSYPLFLSFVYKANLCGWACFNLVIWVEIVMWVPLMQVMKVIMSEFGNTMMEHLSNLGVILLKGFYIKLTDLSYNTLLNPFSCLHFYIDFHYFISIFITIVLRDCSLIQHNDFPILIKSSAWKL